MSGIRTARGECSCDACNVVNYKSRHLAYRGKIVEKMYELTLGHIMVHLCEDCLNELWLKINNLIESGNY